MKTKKMLFKAAVCLMVVMFVFSSVSALAADYYTTTTYNLKTGLATVKTTVTEVSGEVTYLAYNGTNPRAEGAIFYIDQTTANGSANFEYTVEAEKVTNTHSMLVGTTGGKLSTDVEEGAQPKLGTDYELTVNFTGCSVVLTDASNPENTVTLTESGTVTVGNGNMLLWDVVDVNSSLDENTAKAKLNGEAFDGTQVPAITGDATLEITMEEAKRETTIVVETAEDITSADCVSVTNAVNPNTGVTVEVQSLTRMGTITLGDDEITEYGIVVTEENGDTTWIPGGGDVKETEGRFAIIIEGLNGELNASYAVQTYVKVEGKENPIFGATYTYANGNVTIENADN